MLAPAVLGKLSRLLGPEHLLTQPEDLVAYSFDAVPGNVLPDAVVFPADTQQVAAIVRLANEERFPVVPRGSGTNLSGGVVPPGGGVVLLLRRMNRILEIDEGNLTATAQPGVILADFQRAVESRGLFYPPDPASRAVCSLGGTVGEGAGGPRGAKYGTTKDYVIGLEVVLPTGDVVRAGGKTVKNVSGYDLVHLLVGAEGTLGVVTEVTVRLLPAPQARRTALAVFDSLEQATAAVSAIVAARVVPSTLELLDDVSMRCIEAYRATGLPLDAEAVLLMEVDGSAVEVETQLARVVQVARDSGAREVRVAHSEAEAERLWEARRSSYAAMARARPTILVEDATVPRPALLHMVRAIKASARRHRLQVGLIAHAGDGNTHPQIMCDRNDADEMHRVELFTEEIFREALRLGGTLTGEHGIGVQKSRFLIWQYGEEGVAAMRRIKDALDPNGVLNPGKVLPRH